jgi:hypothetical protein
MLDRELEFPIHKNNMVQEFQFPHEQRAYDGLEKYLFRQPLIFLQQQNRGKYPSL